MKVGGNRDLFFSSKHSQFATAKERGTALVEVQGKVITQGAVSD